MNRLISEFRRRNVFRVAALYAVVAWLIAQVADVVIGLGNLPTSIGRVVLIILALGFPVVIALSWAFEWTPEGIRRESGVPDGQAGPRPGMRRMDALIIALLSVAVVYFAATHEWNPAPEATGVSIAVLPFENRSAIPDDLYFTDGIHEDILTQLAKISSLIVISRTSVMPYRGSDKALPKIAAELGVTNILEGGVQRAGNRVRINLQLIEAESDRHLWAETWDRELTAENVFTIQSEIATSIAGILHTKLLPQERESIASMPTLVTEAYDAYLLGRRQLASRSKEDLEAAQRFLQRAVELDPGFALAWAGLADSLMLLSVYGDQQDQGMLEKAARAARQALELAPQLGEANTSYGVVLKNQGSPQEEYAPYLLRGVELAPGSAEARRWLSNYLAEVNRHAEALEHLEKAVRLDPLSPIVRVTLGGAYARMGRHEEAVKQFVKALEIDPVFLPARMSLTEFASNDITLTSMSSAYRVKPGEAFVLMQFVLSYLELGDVIRAAEWLAELDRVAADSLQAKIGRLNLALYRGEEEEAVRWAQALLLPEGGVTVPSRTLMLYDLRHGNLQAALERYRSKYPQLLEIDPVIADQVSAATEIAFLLMAMGDTARADRLLQKTLEFIHTSGGDDQLEYAVSKARVNALQGRHEEALAGLRTALDNGWKFQWWFLLPRDPVFDALRPDPRFQALIDGMSAEMARQLKLVREKEASGEIALPPQRAPDSQAP